MVTAAHKGTYTLMRNFPMRNAQPIRKSFVFEDCSALLTPMDSRTFGAQGERFGSPESMVTVTDGASQRVHPYHRHFLHLLPSRHLAVEL
jgi:hypothetical protein